MMMMDDSRVTETKLTEQHETQWGLKLSKFEAVSVWFCPIKFSFVPEISNFGKDPVISRIVPAQ